MKVAESLKKCNHGASAAPSIKPVPSTPLPHAKENPVEETLPYVEGTTINGCLSGAKLSMTSRSSTYSISDIDSSLDGDLWGASGPEAVTESDTESSDLDAIVTTGVDVCHATTLETFLENLEFVPAEVNRILKLIGILDEKCEEIMELLDRPSDEWFPMHKSKKQRKLQGTETAEGAAHTSEATPGGSNGNKDMMIYRKIYEGQEGIGFDMYKARLARARRHERAHELEMRSNELISIPDNEFRIVCDKDDVSPPGEGSQPPTTHDTLLDGHGKVTKPWDNRAENTSECQEGVKRQTAMSQGIERDDPIDLYFQRLEVEDVSLLGRGVNDPMDVATYGGGQFEETAMGEEWKEHLDEILQENEMNKREHNDMETARSFMENQLTLLWRYTLRKKALARKAYETVLHHYATLIQELEPNQFGASLKCYPEATVVQGSMLNELEEQFVPVEEMTELHRDVEALLAISDEHEDRAVPLTVPTDVRLGTGTADDTPVVVKQEDASTPVPLRPANKKDRPMGEMSANGNFASSRQSQMNGAVSGFVPSACSAHGFPPSGQRQAPTDVQPRRHRDKRLKPTKAPPGMSHAAKSPQSTGRLLTYHDIATPPFAAKLSGRLAELFWPDDDLWYLIHIEFINAETKSADIVYTTGETETLELLDIVKEGHMSLLPETEETDLSADEDMPLPAAEMEICEEVQSDLSPSEIRTGCLDDPSPDEDDLGTEDEEEMIANMQRSRQSRRSEMKTESLHEQLKTL